MAVNEKPWLLANAILDAVVAKYAAEAIMLPSAQFVADGLVAYDGELVAVSLLRMFGASSSSGPAAESLEGTQCLHWRSAQFRVEVIRCAPESTVVGNAVIPPTNDAIEVSARTVMRDAQLMTDGILTAYRSGDFGLGVNLAFEDWAALGPDGGLVGGRLQVRIGLV